MNSAQPPFVRLLYLAMSVANILSFASAGKSFGLFLDIPGHEAPVYALAFSPDGTKLASAGDDQSIAIWDTDTWTLSLRIKSDFGAIHALSFSPDSSIFAAGSDDGTVRLWNTATWSNPKVISAHSRNVRAIAFSRDGKRLVTAGRDRKLQPAGLFGRARSFLNIDKTDDVIKIWNTSQWSLVRTLPRLTSRVVTLSFSPTKNLLASGEENGEVVILNTETWQATKRLQFQHAPLKTLTFNHNGTRLLGGGEKQGLSVWKMADWALAEDKTLKLQAVDYNPTENQVAAGSRDGTVKLFSDIGTKTLETVQKNLKFNKPVNVMRFSPDGQTLVFGSNDGSVKVAQPSIPIPTPIPIPLVAALTPIPRPQPVLSITPSVPIPIPFVTSSFDEPSSDSFISFLAIGLLAAVGFWLRRVFAASSTSEVTWMSPKNQGYVYLLKAGDYYKIGRSKNFERRVKEIKLQLPFPVEQIHVARVNDMVESEKKWHKRFKAKRANGEWFLLSNADVREFKRQS